MNETDWRKIFVIFLFFGMHYVYGVSILVAIFLLFLRFFIPFGEISIFLKPPLKAVSVQRLKLAKLPTGISTDYYYKILFKINQLIFSENPKSRQFGCSEVLSNETANFVLGGRFRRVLKKTSSKITHNNSNNTNW